MKTNHHYQTSKRCVVVSARQFQAQSIYYSVHYLVFIFIRQIVSWYVKIIRMNLKKYIYLKYYFFYSENFRCTLLLLEYISFVSTRI